MRYFHRTSVSPDDTIEAAARYFGGRLAPVEESARSRRFSSPLGQLTVTAEAEGGHYTRVVVSTDQPGESELDRRAKRFLAVVHADAEPEHLLRGAY